MKRRVEKGRLRAHCQISAGCLLLVCGSVLGSTTNTYHMRRSFVPLQYSGGSPSVYGIIIGSSNLVGSCVKAPTNAIVDTGTTYAVEYQSMALGYGVPESAWEAVKGNYQQNGQVHSNAVYDNTGWVKGVREEYGQWGAYLWLLQNHITFQSSPTNVWVSPFGVTNTITNVLVGTIGDYAPITTVTDVGPTNSACDVTNTPADAPGVYLGPNTSTDITCTSSLDTYYQCGMPVLKVEFKELWETTNRVNQVFNPTPKDDPPPTLANKIYVVESPDSLYHVTLDVDDQPASMRSKLMYAVFVDGAKISGSDGFYPATGPADITFDHPSLSAAVEKDFELRVGYDLNGNSVLDSTEEMPLFVKNTVGTVIGSPIARGTSSPRYPVAMGVVDAAVLDTVTLPHASRLLQIFRDGAATGLPTGKAPTATIPVTFNCYSDPWAVWLTHNAGASFNSFGTASIQQYVWDASTSLADLVCKSHQMKTAAESFYNSTVLTVANSFFATNPVGTTATFPLDGTAYNIPHTDESPLWVTNYLAGVTVTFDEPSQWNVGFDDVFGTIGRGRVLSHTARYTVEKRSDIFGDYLKVTLVNYAGVVEDLYDFNQDGGGAGEEAAIIQLGHGNGGYGSGRTSGVIYKDRIEFNQNLSNPF